ncbi:hypothetical protein HYX58_00290 [Candidatus Dependentiae bacterium]|nr:hypothetical protein [Candidatus Dependentiae bacterium]
MKLGSKLIMLSLLAIAVPMQCAVYRPATTNLNQFQSPLFQEKYEELVRLDDIQRASVPHFIEMIQGVERVWLRALNDPRSSANEKSRAQNFLARAAESRDALKKLAHDPNFQLSDADTILINAFE